MLLFACFIYESTAQGDPFYEATESVEFDGTDSELSISLPSLTTFGTQLTVAMYIQPTALAISSNAVLATGGRLSTIQNTYGEFVFSLQNGHLHFFDRDSGSGFGFQGESTGVLWPNERYFVSFVRFGVIGTFYINGEPSGVILSGNSVSYTKTDVAIGYDPKSIYKPFQGYIDHIYLSTFALNEYQIYSYFGSSVTKQPTAKPTEAPNFHQQLADEKDKGRLKKVEIQLEKMKIQQLKASKPLTEEQIENRIEKRMDEKIADLKATAQRFGDPYKKPDVTKEELDALKSEIEKSKKEVQKLKKNQSKESSKHLR